MLKVKIFTHFITFFILLASCNNDKKSAHDSNVEKEEKAYYSFSRERTEKNYLVTDLDDIAENTAIINLYGDTVFHSFLSKYEKLPNLQELKFNSCTFINLDSILKEISNHSKIRELVFEDCNIHKLPIEIRNLKSLKVIEIKQYEPQLTLDPAFFQLSDLEKISLSFVKDCQYLQKHFSKFRNLTELRLKCCGIKSLDTSLLVHPSLTKIDLFGNKIQRITQVRKINPNLLELDVNQTPLGNRIKMNPKKFFNSSEYSQFKRNFPNCELIYYTIMKVK